MTSPMTSDPEIMGGTPVFGGTHVPFRTLLDDLENGAPLPGLLKDFPGVSREIVVAASREAGERASDWAHALARAA